MTTEKPLIILIKEALSQGTLNIPVFHTVAVKLQEILAHDSFTINEVTDLISADQALAAQVLKIANSPYYAGLTEITTINNAVVRLGSQEVANIAMLATQRDTYKTVNPQFREIMQSLWHHAIGCAAGSKWLAKRIGSPEIAPEAFMAGLLHDVGKLFLLKAIEQVSCHSTSSVPISYSLINEILQAMHEDEGYAVMKRWNLPEIYRDIARHHHTDDWDTNNQLLAIVRLANKACIKLGVGMDSADIVLLLTPEAEVLGIQEITLAELEIKIEDAVQSIT